MAAPKGHPSYGGGRKPGQPNKVTTDVRAAIAVFAQAHVEQMGAWLMDVEDPAKRLDLYLRAIEYHIPKLGRQEISGPDGKPIPIETIERRIIDPAN